MTTWERALLVIVGVLLLLLLPATGSIGGHTHDDHEL